MENNKHLNPLVVDAITEECDFLDFVRAAQVLMTLLSHSVLFAGKQHSSMYPSNDKDAVLPVLSGHAIG